jgi:hypothetical protein
MLLLSGFIDTYLKLEPQEESILQSELDKIGIREKESVMNIVTSWMEQGIAQAESQSCARGEIRCNATPCKALRAI